MSRQRKNPPPNGAAAAMDIKIPDVTAAAYPDGVPKNEDGSIVSEADVPVEQARKIGAVTPESAQYNRDTARKVHRKQQGEADVRWGELDALHVFDSVKMTFSPTNIYIYIARTDPEPFDYRPFPMTAVKNGAEFYDYVLRNVHKSSGPSKYVVRFKESNGSERGRGYLRMPDTLKEAGGEMSQQQPPPNFPPINLPYGPQPHYGQQYPQQQYGYGGYPPPQQYGGYPPPQLPPPGYGYQQQPPPGYFPPQYPQQPPPQQPPPPQAAPAAPPPAAPPPPQAPPVAQAASAPEPQQQQPQASQYQQPQPPPQQAQQYQQPQYQPQYMGAPPQQQPPPQRDEGLWAATATTYQELKDTQNMIRQNQLQLERALGELTEMKRSQMHQQQQPQYPQAAPPPPAPSQNAPSVVVMTPPGFGAAPFGQAPYGSQQQPSPFGQVPYGAPQQQPQQPIGFGAHMPVTQEAPPAPQQWGMYAQPPQSQPYQPQQQYGMGAPPPQQYAPQPQQQQQQYAPQQQQQQPQYAPQQPPQTPQGWPQPTATTTAQAPQGWPQPGVGAPPAAPSPQPAPVAAQVVPPNPLEQFQQATGLIVGMAKGVKDMNEAMSRLTGQNGLQQQMYEDEEDDPRAMPPPIMPPMDPGPGTPFHTMPLGMTDAAPVWAYNSDGSPNVTGMILGNLPKIPQWFKGVMDSFVEFQRTQQGGAPRQIGMGGHDIVVEQPQPQQQYAPPPQQQQHFVPPQQPQQQYVPSPPPQYTQQPQPRVQHAPPPPIPPMPSGFVPSADALRQVMTGQ